VQARLDEAMAKANLAADNAMMLEHKVSNLELELSEVRCASARRLPRSFDVADALSAGEGRE
jgi:hypothetical protein